MTENDCEMSLLKKQIMYMQVKIDIYERIIEQKLGLNFGDVFSEKILENISGNSVKVIEIQEKTVNANFEKINECSSVKFHEKNYPEH